MGDRRISYSSGNFSSIERADAGRPDRLSDGILADLGAAGAETGETGAGSVPGGAGNTGSIRDAGVEDAGPKATAGSIGRTGRRHARIRDVTDLGAVLAEARAKREDRKQRHSTVPDLFQDDRTATALDTGGPAGADSGRTPANPERGDAGTDRVAARPENALPLKVAELDEMSGKRLDLAEFVIHAAVTGDDDGAIQIPWAPETHGRAGNGAAAGRAASASGPGEPLRPDPETAAYGGGATASGGETAGEESTARHTMDGPSAKPAPGAVPSGGNPINYRNAIPDLSIPIFDEDDIPSVRARYEDEESARETGSAQSDGAGASETAQTKQEESSGTASGRVRQAGKSEVAAVGGKRTVRELKPLAGRPDVFEADRRTNIYCGLAIAAALGAVAWYIAGPGTAPTQTVVDAARTDIAAPKDRGKAGAKASGSAAAGPARKAPIYLPAKRIEPAAARALGNLEYRITPKTVDRVVTSARGDTFGNMLLRAGVGAEETALAVMALRKVYDPRRLPIGLELKVIFEAPGIRSPRFLGYRFDSSIDRMVRVSRQATGDFAARQVEKIVTQVHSRAEGQIETSLFGAGIKAGVPPQVMLQMVRLFSFTVDFQRDLHGGEKFHIMYRSQMDEAGRIVRHSDIVYASLSVGGKTQKLYLYKRSNGGAAEYLNERGHGNRRALMKTPIDGARLTSRFGYRKHPLLGFTKLHSGVDFGARPGTPIFAAGDGTIAKIGWFGAYGRYIRIRHGRVYETAYAHLSRFRRGLRVGSRVKQGETIGYVGNSGRSTGPHLHYEVLRDGQHVNPMKIALPSRKNLRGRELTRFLAHRKEVDARFAALGKADERLQEGTVQTVRSGEATGCKDGAKIDSRSGQACN